MLLSLVIGHWRNCNLPTSIEGLREQAVKKLRQGILGKQLLDFTFQMSYDRYNDFLDKFKLGTVGPDPNMYLIHSMALCLHNDLSLEIFIFDLI